MSLLDDLKDEASLKEPPIMRCGFCKALANMTTEEADRLKVLIQDESITKRRLAQVLANNGHPVGVNTLYRHAKGMCYGSTR